MRSFRADSGSTVFFVAMLLPVVCLALALGVELRGYYFTTERVQQIVDDAALLGQDQMPDLSKAERLANDYLSAKIKALQGIEDPSSKVTITDESVSVTVTGKVPGTFSTVLAKLTGSKIESLALRAESEARFRPVDGVVILDRSGIGGGCGDGAFARLKEAALKTYLGLSVLSENKIGLSVTPFNSIEPSWVLPPQASCVLSSISPCVVSPHEWLGRNINTESLDKAICPINSSDLPHEFNLIADQNGSDELNPYLQVFSLLQATETFFFPRTEPFPGGAKQAAFLFTENPVLISTAVREFTESQVVVVSSISSGEKSEKVKRITLPDREDQVNAIVSVIVASTRRSYLKR